MRSLAAARNIIFGAEVTLADITPDPDYAALVARECAIITPGIEAKWGNIEPGDGEFRFGSMDALAEFARGAGLRLHMHNVIWAVGLPAWTLQALRQGRGAPIIARHAAIVAGRYKDITESWTSSMNLPIHAGRAAPKDCARRRGAIYRAAIRHACARRDTCGGTRGAAADQ
ncbi:MAG: endo-1,4-beta-xylanase [Rhodospirillales bacterium]